MKERWKIEEREVQKSQKCKEKKSKTGRGAEMTWAVDLHMGRAHNVDLHMGMALTGDLQMGRAHNGDLHTGTALK